MSVSATPGLDQGQLLDNLFALREGDIVVSDLLAKNLIQCASSAEYSAYRLYAVSITGQVYVTHPCGKPILYGAVNISAELSDDEDHIEWVLAFETDLGKLVASGDFDLETTLHHGNPSDIAFSKAEIERSLRPEAQRALKSYIS